MLFRSVSQSRYQAQLNYANLERSLTNAQAATSLAVRQAEQQANALDANTTLLQLHHLMKSSPNDVSSWHVLAAYPLPYC